MPWPSLSEQLRIVGVIDTVSSLEISVEDLGRIVPEYLIEWLGHPLTRQRVKRISTVAVQQVNVNPTRLRELEIELPVDLEEQRRIVRSLTACDDRIRREEEELAKLRRMKIGLTEDLLAGV